jgi:hypothetical protein
MVDDCRVGGRRVVEWPPRGEAGTVTAVDVADMVGIGNTSLPWMAACCSCAVASTFIAVGDMLCAAILMSRLGSLYVLVQRL